MYNLFWIQNRPFFDNLKELKIHVYHLRILKKAYIYITLHIEWTVINAGCTVALHNQDHRPLYFYQ